MARNGSARAGACVVVVVSGALLVGCDGGSDPTTSAATASVTTTSAAPTSSSSSASSSSTSASASESTTSEAYVPVKPKFPAAAKKQTDEGAVAFTEYYWESVNYAATKPDNSALPPLGTDDCEGCALMEESVSSLVKASQRFSQPPAIPSAIELLFNSEDGARVLVSVKASKVPILDADGKQVRRAESLAFSRLVDLRWRDGWKVSAIVVN